MEQNRIHVKEHIGIVTNDTSTIRLNFLITPLKNRTSVEKTDYIVLDHPTKGETDPVLAEVMEVKGYEEVVGASITDKNAGNLVATANIIGYVNLQQQNRPIQRLLTPPNPGSRVYLPYSDFLEDTFSRNTEGKTYKTTIQLGAMETAAVVAIDNKKPLEFCLNAETLTTTHTLVTGATRTGKTNIAISLVKEIAKKTQHAIAILDPYGEYNILQYSTKKTQTITLNPNENPGNKILRNMNPGQTTILRAAGLLPEEKRKVFSQCLSVLWKTRLERKTPPFLLIVENAETLKNDVLEAISWEGTKQGIAMLLIAKHATELGGRILSQTSTQIIGRTIDKDDLDYLDNIALRKAALLPQLKRGEWIVNSPNNLRTTQIRTK